MRTAIVERKTKETKIKIELNLDGTGETTVKTPIGFLTHMIETFAKHGVFNLEMEVHGDTEVDQHHTVEDTGIAMGEAFKKALGDKKGICRAGCFVYPMDEALAMTAVDISNRSHFTMCAPFENKKVGDLCTELLDDFFQGFVGSLGATLHVHVYYGRSDHHKIEAIFKAFGCSLKNACAIEKRREDSILSTKGIL